MLLAGRTGTTDGENSKTVRCGGWALLCVECRRDRRQRCFSTWQSNCVPFHVRHSLFLAVLLFYPASLFPTHFLRDGMSCEASATISALKSQNGQPLPSGRCGLGVFGESWRLGRLGRCGQSGPGHLGQALFQKRSVARVMHPPKITSTMDPPMHRKRNDV